MDKTRWDRMQELFDAALALPAAQRSGFLQHECTGDDALLAEVQGLLEAHTGDLPKWTTSIGAQVKEVVDSRIGKHIGPHQILDKIGVGGMGIIYKAYDSRLDRHVALKFMPGFLNSDREARERFMTEARAASRLDHPHICVIHDVNETPDGQLFITMPFYDGETLDKRISRGALPLAEAVDISIQIGDGLAEAHRHHIVHRDIKPANIMLTEHGSKILDFGIAKLDNIKLTSTGSSIGTMAYMSPEQLRGEAVDARADVWALGATLFEMISGKRAFPGEGLPQIVHAVLYAPDDPVQSLTSDLPSPLLSILQRSLARKLEQRFPNMDAMLDELLNLRHQLTGKRPAPTTTAKPVNNSKSRYAWEESVLNDLADILLPYIGPMASMMVNTAARQAADLTQLSNLLAEKLPSPQERGEFQRKVKLQLAARTHPPIPQTVHTNGTVSGIKLTPEQLALLEASFTPYIGPIAGAMIRRAASQAMQFEDLCQSLANQIPNENERQQFLQQVNDAAK